MKHLTTILAAILAAVGLSGCVDNRTPEERQEQWQQYLDDRYDGYIKTVNHRRHSYILYSEYRTGGGITHDPDCPCQNSRTLRELLADTAFLNQFHQASERAAAEATAETADARRRAKGFSPKLTKGGEE